MPAAREKLFTSRVHDAQQLEDSRGPDHEKLEAMPADAQQLEIGGQQRANPGSSSDALDTAG